MEGGGWRVDGPVQVLLKKVNIISYIKLSNRVVRLFSTLSPYACYVSV